mmetsp:Transcript_53821/g.139148  ORF Transcript_53821/g.139148 Transcript_53821/m.139148 type:complete len:278 (-) Transcript_53821:407-1240(-)
MQRSSRASLDRRGTQRAEDHRLTPRWHPGSTELAPEEPRHATDRSCATSPHPTRGAPIGKQQRRRLQTNPVHHVRGQKPAGARFLRLRPQLRSRSPRARQMPSPPRRRSELREEPDSDSAASLGKGLPRPGRDFSCPRVPSPAGRRPAPAPSRQQACCPLAAPHLRRRRHHEPLGSEHRRGDRRRARRAPRAKTRPSSPKRGARRRVAPRARRRAPGRRGGARRRRFANPWRRARAPPGPGRGWAPARPRCRRRLCGGPRRPPHRAPSPNPSQSACL